MGPVNVSEFQEIAEKNLDFATYDYIAGGAEDEYTLRANVEAFHRVWLRRRVMVDVSQIDTSLELLGLKLDFPILLDPATKNAIVPNGDRVAAVAAHESGVAYCVSNAISWRDELYRAFSATNFWTRRCMCTSPV